MRWIMHVDMDAFFASVEQMDHPEYQGKPLIVCGLSSRGVVSTCSYEARKYGVHSAMSTVKAQQLCPQGIFIPGRHWRYAEVSSEIMAIFHEFSPCVEPLSIDEAFLDLSGMEKLVGDVESLGEKIKARIKKDVGLTASVGLAPNKFLAKLASDLDKPNGLVIIHQNEAAAFIAPLPVGKIFGVGARTQESLKHLGITTIGQLASADPAYLRPVLGNSTDELHLLARGLDNRSVINDWEQKSIGKENTFMVDLHTEEERHKALWDLCQQVGWRLRLSKRVGHTVTLKVKYNDFKSITRSITTEVPVSLDEDIFSFIQQLATTVKWSRPVRLLGVSLGKIAPEGEILLDLDDNTKKKKRIEAIDALKKKFGENIIHRG
jgi:DNA polymerase-4